MPKKNGTRSTRTVLARRFSHHLSRIRERKGLSQSALARKLDVTPSMVSKMESDDPSNQRDPSLDTAERVAKALGVDPGQLFRPIRNRPSVKEAP